MSRVHEAMQRAAAAPSSGPTPQPQLLVPAEPDAPAPEPDSFPSELPTAERAPSARAAFAIRPAGTASDLSDPEAPPEGSIPERMDASVAAKVVTDNHIIPVSREQYRRLAAVLHDAQVNAGTSVILVGSAVAGEGKTLTACNLALTLSESYRNRVLLIDADLRKPTLHRMFHINSAGGLSDGLDDPDARLIVRQVSWRLSVLPGGRPSSDPMAGLTSARMRQLIADARRSFDWVIIDTPPLVLLPDAHLLAAMADVAVLVVKAQSTPHHLVARAVEALGRKRIIGTVLNQAKVPPAAYGGYDEYYGGPLPRAHTP